MKCFRATATTKSNKGRRNWYISLGNKKRTFRWRQRHAHQHSILVLGTLHTWYSREKNGWIVGACIPFPFFHLLQSDHLFRKFRVEYFPFFLPPPTQQRWQRKFNSLSRRKRGETNILAMGKEVSDSKEHHPLNTSHPPIFWQMLGAKNQQKDASDES